MPKIAKSKPDRNERRRNKRRLDRLNSKKPPRCPNRFILYRRHKQNEFFNDPSNPIDMRKLSKVIAKMWEKEPPEIKNYWDQVAEREKLNSSYRTSFDVINGLDISISMHSDETVTFVHATASSTETHQRSTTNNISEDFIFEFEQEPTTPPESPEPSFTNESSQPTSDDDAGSTAFNLSLSNLSLSSFTEQIEPTEQTIFIDPIIDPMLTEPNMPTMYGEYSYFSDEQGFIDFDGLYTSNSSPPADEHEGYLPPHIEDEMFFVTQC